MRINETEIKKQFTDGLKECLARPNEQVLSKAYERGRQLMEEGWSELDIIKIYHESLFLLQQDSHEENTKEVMDRASEYLAEWLAPFEVRLNGYRELVDEVRKKNKQLEKEVTHRRDIQQSLRNSKQYYQSLLEHAQDIITVIDYNRRIRFSSPAVEQILGYSRRELSRKNIFQYFHPDDRKKAKDVFEELIDQPGKVSTVEFRFRHLQGHWVYLEAAAKTIPDNDDGPVIVVNARDISERKEAMAELEERTSQLMEAQEIAKIGSWEWWPEEEKLEWSDELFHIFGMSRENFEGNFKSYINYVHPHDRPRVKSKIEEAIKSQDSFNVGHKIVQPDGTQKDLLCRGRMVNLRNGTKKMVGTAQDVTEQKETEQKLREYSESLRRLSGRIERAREDERISVARQVHDELGQMLSVLKMDLSLFLGSVDEVVSMDNNEQIEAEAQQVLDRVNKIIASVQRITTELRPEVLDEMGLIDAIDWQGHKFQERTNIDVNFDYTLEHTDFLDQEQITTLFRIFQETLTNIVRHAEASIVQIELKRDEENLYLIIKDNGIGITENQLNKSSSLGIIGMRERTQLMGGSVNIEGEKGVGTTVTLQIPINESFKS